MGNDGLHVVFGTGQVGRALAGCLAGRGLAVRAVSRRRPPGLAGGADWRAADAADPDGAREAAQGAAVVYQCLNAPYSRWPELFPPLQRGALAAAESAGALLVTLENLYGYGPPAAGRAMTEDLPLGATTVKGRTRAAMTEELLAAAAAGRVRVAIGRASDFFGAGVTDGSVLGRRVFGSALAGRRADFIGNPDLPHTYSYVPDIAEGLATLRPAPPGSSWTWSRAWSGTPWPSARCRSWPCARWGWSARRCGRWRRWPTSSTCRSFLTPPGTRPRSGRPARRSPPPSRPRSPGTGPRSAHLTARTGNRHDHLPGRRDGAARSSAPG
jgi:hypothetical protein